MQSLVSVLQFLCQSQCGDHRPTHVKRLSVQCQRFNWTIALRRYEMTVTLYCQQYASSTDQIYRRSSGIRSMDQHVHRSATASLKPAAAGIHYQHKTVSTTWAPTKQCRKRVRRSSRDFVSMSSLRTRTRGRRGRVWSIKAVGRLEVAVVALPVLQSCVIVLLQARQHANPDFAM